MRHADSSTTAGLGESSATGDDELQAPERRRAAWGPRVFIVIAASVAVVVAMSLGITAMRSHRDDDAAKPISSQRYFTTTQVLAACDALIASNRDPGSGSPDVTVCVARGSDEQHIEGLSVMIAPEVYSSLSPGERDSVERDMAERIGMPVSLKSGDAPTPLAAPGR